MKKRPPKPKLPRKTRVMTAVETDLVAADEIAIVSIDVNEPDNPWTLTLKREDDPDIVIEARVRFELLPGGDMYVATTWLGDVARDLNDVDRKLFVVAMETNITNILKDVDPDRTPIVQRVMVQ